MPFQRPPATGPAREALRAKGQFWTPPWVAEAMAGYVLLGPGDCLFDPAVGEGAFFEAGKTVARELGKAIQLRGCEVDPGVLERAGNNGLARDLGGVELRNFVLDPPQGPFAAIVANPPYIRHHRLPLEVKARLRKLGVELLGKPLDGRAGLHVYFLLRALQLLRPEGRLAFILPADTCEGVFAPALWGWITGNYRLEAVITFGPRASPFPGVDTNPLIVLIRRAGPVSSFWWARCEEAESGGPRKWILSGFRQVPRQGLTVVRRDLAEGLRTGFSRPVATGKASPYRLADFARVLRGIATGDNDFFFLTREQANTRHLPSSLLIPAVGRTRDVVQGEITGDVLQALDAAGRPTLLFSPDGRPLEEFPPAVQAYLKAGAAKGLPARPLIASRRPWYRMERRQPPPFLFAYLGRRNTRFLRNRAGVVPLTGFLCLYPFRTEPDHLDRLWTLLNHPETLANLSLVGKSYGDGCLKVEPRALERLPLPGRVVKSLGLQPEPFPLDIVPRDIAGAGGVLKD